MKTLVSYATASQIGGPTDNLKASRADSVLSRLRSIDAMLSGLSEGLSGVEQAITGGGNPAEVATPTELPDGGFLGSLEAVVSSIEARFGRLESCTDRLRQEF